MSLSRGPTATPPSQRQATSATTPVKMSSPPKRLIRKPDIAGGQYRQVLDLNIKPIHRYRLRSGRPPVGTYNTSARLSKNRPAKLQDSSTLSSSTSLSRKRSRSPSPELGTPISDKSALTALSPGSKTVLEAAAAHVRQRRAAGASRRPQPLDDDDDDYSEVAKLRIAKRAK
ncbi:hypothetical protein D9758_005850 [Tetrapyrgos nigripes]|uniref:Uncharacterized protein n=1 Tax=Tetrapyrgos nigripes TaxID=182062 RepID=A0A8H5G2Y1_9AGAR|nr:hypothetical protein D9758_005850 [Tetrapyrgos nigripes]